MATLDPKKGYLSAGIAGQSSDTINPQMEPVTTGEVSDQLTVAYPLGADVVVQTLEVVGFDEGGFIVPAVHGTEGVAAIGIVAADVDNDGGDDGDVMVEVHRIGVFNPNVLIWDASFDTLEKKRLAFEGAPTPTMIFIRKPTTMTV